MRADLGDETKRVTSLEHIDIDDIYAVQYSQVNCFSRQLSKVLHNRARKLGQRRLKAGAASQTRQLGTDHVVAVSVPKQIALGFKMTEKSVGSAFINPSLFSNLVQLKAVWNTI